MVGADATLDYLCCPGAAKIVHSLPSLGWIDASSVGPGLKAAPCLAITAVAAAAHFDWDAVALAPLMDRAELGASFTPTALSAFADGLASLGVFDRIYMHTIDFYGAYEVALARAPTPSPFLISAADMEEISSFSTAGTPGVPGVAAVPAVAAIAAIPRHGGGRLHSSPHTPCTGGLRPRWCRLLRTPP